jgi:hypothetical protein
MHFWPGKTLGYESVDSNDDNNNSLNGHSQSRSRRGFSRSALFATIIIAQVLVLASSNIAAYTLGKTQSHIQFPMSSRVVQSESIGGPKGLLPASHHNISSIDLKQFAHSPRF